MTVRLYYNAVDRRAQASNEWHAEWISKRGLKARLRYSPGHAGPDPATESLISRCAAQCRPGKSLETEGSEKSRSDTRFQNMAGTTSRMAGCAG